MTTSLCSPRPWPAPSAIREQVAKLVEALTGQLPAVREVRLVEKPAPTA
jgi:hypothetical protein